MIQAVVFVASLLVGTTYNSADRVSDLRVGDAFEIVNNSDVEYRSTGGGMNGEQHDHATLMIRVLSADADGVVFEMDHPIGTSEADRQREWSLPARIFRPTDGPSRLLNTDELIARLDTWLARANLTREQCGHWGFTWTAYKIECDPETVLALFDAWFPATPVVGTIYQHPLAARPVPFVECEPQKLCAVLPIDPDRVRAQRVETDSIVRQMFAAYRNLPATNHAADAISGTITVRFEIGADGREWLRSEEINIDTTKPDGRVETSITHRTLRRRLIGRN